MSEPLELQMRGLEQIERALHELPDKLARNVLRGALRAAAKPIAEEAFALAPVSSGALASSVRVTSRMKNGVPSAAVKAGGKSARSASVFWARWVEKGTTAHEIRPKGEKSLFFAGINARIVNHPGARQRRFIQAAVDARIGQATQALIAYARKRLAKEGVNVPDPEPETDEE